jgi:hypothetical protein
MKISTAIEERVPGRLCVVSDSIQQKKRGRDLHIGPDRSLQTVSGKAIGLDQKHTECKVIAFDIRASAGFSATEDGDGPPAVTADQEKPAYVSTRRIVGQYEIDKASLQIPRVIINKYREAEGYKRPAVSTLQIYA